MSLGGNKFMRAINENQIKGGYAMAKYACSICGFVYDETNGIPDDDIVPGTRWEELPNDWVCPLCGAEKSEFEKQGEPTSASEEKAKPVINTPQDVQELSPLEISALCTMLPEAKTPGISCSHCLNKMQKIFPGKQWKN